MANGVGLYLVDASLSEFCIVSSAVEACQETAVVEPYPLFVAAVCLAVINMFVKPMLKLISLPFVFLSMGLFLFVINAVVLWLLVWVVEALELSNVHIVVVDGGAMTYIYGAVILGLFNMASHWLVTVK